MHIPENYLSPETCAVMSVVMLPVWYLAVKKVKEEMPKDKLPLLGIGAAFCFLGMMFNVPLPGGTTGHAVGGTLLAVLLGPWAACLTVTVALFIQALFFGDGGILSFGANCFNMAFALPFTGYFIYTQLKKYGVSWYASAAAGAYAGINVAAFCAAVEFGIQPLLFTDAAGRALYCPYPLNISIPAMMVGHLTLFGLAEVIFTVAILAYLKRTTPQIVTGEKLHGGLPLYGLLMALIVCTPLGLLAAGTAWGEWEPEALAGQEFLGTPLGYIPSGMEQGLSFLSLFPEYSVAGLPDAVGYILSAVIGTTLIILIFRIAASFIPHKVDYGKTIHGA